MNVATKRLFPMMTIALCAAVLTGCVESDQSPISSADYGDPSLVDGEPGESAMACAADGSCAEELSAHAPRVWFQAVGEQDDDCTDGICRTVLVNHGDSMVLWLHDRERIVDAVEIELTDFGYDRLEAIEARLSAGMARLPSMDGPPDAWDHFLVLRTDRSVDTNSVWFEGMSAPPSTQSLAWFAISMLQQARACSSSPMFDYVGGDHCAPEMP